MSGINQFVGTWKVDKSRDENFDEMLKAMDINMVKRKLAAQASPTHVITVDGEKITIEIRSIKNNTETFTLGVEQSVKNEDKAAKTLAEYKDDELKITSKFEDGKTITATRKIVNGDLVLTRQMEGKDFVAKRVFKKA